MDEQTKQQIKKLVKETVENYDKFESFTKRKTFDTPGDALLPANRRFVTLNGALTARPVSSVAVVGQRYFDTTNNVPIFYTVAGWRNSVGSIVALNN